MSLERALVGPGSRTVNSAVGTCSYPRVRLQTLHTRPVCACLWVCLHIYSFLRTVRCKQLAEEAFKNIPQRECVFLSVKCIHCTTHSLWGPFTNPLNWCSIVCAHVSAGYDVQSASTPDGVLYITGAPRYNHTGRVIIYRLNDKNNIVVSQILKGDQVSLFSVWCFG